MNTQRRIDTARGTRILKHVATQIDTTYYPLTQAIRYESSKVEEFVKMLVSEYGTDDCNILNTVSRIKRGEFLLAGYAIEQCWDAVYSHLTRAQRDILGII